MKIAICLHGNLGSIQRSSDRNKLYLSKNINNKDNIIQESHKNYYPIEYGYNHLKKIFIDNYDCDIFFHCWNNNEEDKKKLLSLYKPKKYIIEEQKNFEINLADYNLNEKDLFDLKLLSNISQKGYNNLFNSRLNNNNNVNDIIKELNILGFRTTSRCYSMKQSLNLLDTYKKENNIEYDWLLICRFDSFWNFPKHHGDSYNINYKIDMGKLIDNNIYVEKRIGRIDYEYAIYDLWLLLPKKHISLFNNFYDNRHKYCMRCPIAFFEFINDYNINISNLNI